ncbi:phosphate ABC transporter substrate-binding protein [Vallitalea okinawensis]|uniref:phosphate ABC transporter substrate-binding protein n=1 Tax=Vallitalea okinawensis TaxID=2078660 RepID=UPI001FA905FD|nr:phosphate ABC transporter substrate-binding protein [Vallitalea okinawensis]
MKKLSLLLAIVLSFSLFFVACGSDNQSSDSVPLSLEGEVTISGSTSVEKVMVGLAEEFMALNPGVEVTYESIGSSAGIKNANEGITMIGTASRNLKEKEVAWGIESKAIAYDGIAVITHPNNSVSELTKDQVAAIYKGQITNWNEVGGEDQEIVVVSREDGSGTRGAFEEIVDFEDALTATAILAEGNGNVQTTVAGNPNAIGYVSFTYINETVQSVLIDGSEPTTENVLAETYPIARPFLIAYHEENLSEEAKVFMDFIFTSEGQYIVEEKGGIPVAN